MRIVCPGGLVDWRQYLTTELEQKLQQLGSFAWFDGSPETVEGY